MSKKILIVDEKPFMLRLIQHHLERAGYELIKAHNHKEAQEAINHEAPQLVVLDDYCTSRSLSNPSRSNRDFSEQSKIPVIRVTDIPQLHEDSSHSDDVVMTKPFSPTHFVAEVRRLVAGS